jgi:hypothetical protein
VGRKPANVCVSAGLNVAAGHILVKAARLRTETRYKAGLAGQVSEPIIAKPPSSFSRSGKSRACAAKVIRLIQGDPSSVSARRACSKAERSVVNTVRGRRKSAEVVVLPRHTPVPSGRTKP